MHLVIYFCGTGNPAEGFPSKYNYVPKDDKRVCTLFVKGCEHPEVCNSSLFPDLKGFARRFTQKLFGKDKKLATTQTEDLESIGISTEQSTVQGTEEPIDSITLFGYSRGAVTCFEIARQLNQIYPKVPVDIVADQPVPGNFYQGPFTNAASITDCSDLRNLGNVSVILGSYTGATTAVDLYVKLQKPTDKELIQYKNSYLLVKKTLYYVKTDGSTEEVRMPLEEYLDKLYKHFGIDPKVERQHSLPPLLLTDHFAPEAQHETTNPIHRGFFSQIVPKLPRSAQRDLIIIPRESHHQDRVNAPSGEEHMHMQVAKYLNKKGLVTDEMVQQKVADAKSTYSQHEVIPPNPFPIVDQLQSFFGLKKDDAYRYVDKLHPTLHIRKGMSWEAKESLIDWWSKHDRNTSYFSTQLTKDLVAVIAQTPRDNVDQFKALFIKTEHWLVAKENSSTSRYYQVESLRDNIYHHLVIKLGVPKQEMDQLNRKNLHDTGYFLKHWSEGSSAASWFKTDQTRVLDKVFEVHAKEPQSKENDIKLLQALETWREAKKDTQSKRFDLVVEMSEHLHEVIANGYESSPEQGQTLAR